MANKFRVAFVGSLILIGNIGLCTASENGNFNSAIIAWKSAFQSLMSGFKTNSQIIENSSDQSSQMQRSAKQGGASARIEADQNLSIYEAVNNRSYQTGQGYNVCRTVFSNMIAADTDTTADKVRLAAKKVDQDWMTKGSDASAFIAMSLANRQQYYCSSAERRSGLCTSSASGGFSAGDSDAAIWLRNRSYGSEELATAADFIDAAAPLPTIAEKNNNASDAISRITATRKASLVSGARQALYHIAISGMEGEGNANQTPQ